MCLHVANASVLRVTSGPSRVSFFLKLLVKQRLAQELSRLRAKLDRASEAAAAEQLGKRTLPLHEVVCHLLVTLAVLTFFHCRPPCLIPRVVFMDGRMGAWVSL